MAGESKLGETKFDPEASSVLDEDVRASESVALRMSWVFGFNNSIIGGMHSLVDEDRDAIFYVTAHTGVVYDYRSKTQKLLQGHCNSITSCCVSADKRWIATADAGSDSMIVIWDSHACTPIKTIFNPHPDGVAAMDLSPDAMHIATLSNVPEDSDAPQSIAVWAWTDESEGPVRESDVPTVDMQKCVKFNPDNVHEVVTNGRERVVFWNWGGEAFKYFAPPVSQRDVRQPVNEFTCSIFVPDTTQAITGTVDGDIIIWDHAPTTDGVGGRASDKSALKVVRICQTGAVEFVCTVKKYVVTGSVDGAVRFFDKSLRLVAWFEDMDGGPVTSVSFAAVGGSVAEGTSRKKKQDGDVDADLPDLEVPDFLIGTRQSLAIGLQASLFKELSPEQRRGTLLLQAFDDEVHGLAAHPFLPQFACTVYSGAVHLWDYEQRQLLIVRLFDVSKDRPHCVAFDVHGSQLAIGTTSGSLLFLDPVHLTDLQPPVRELQGAITNIVFSHDGHFMATADSTNHVAVYRFMETEVRAAGDAGRKKEWEVEAGEVEARKTREQWVYLGRHKSHSRAITGLEFGVSETGEATLVSVGEDKRLVEYDIPECSIVKGVPLKGARAKIEQSAAPTALMWMPKDSSSREQVLVTANDEYKFKLWNGNSKACRRTVLSPTFGGPVNRLVAIPVADPDGAGEDGEGESKGERSATSFVAYSTADKVVGMVKLPLDGNPNRTMGLIAHPGEVSEIGTSYDGRVLLTAGGSDSTIAVWDVDTGVMDEAVARGGDDIEPFLELLDGGKDGYFFKEISDFFVYAQLRSQGEDTTKPRVSGPTVKLEQLPNLMRALGYYPTEQEVDNLCGEVRYSRFTETGVTVEEVTLNELIRLYVNHRPVLGIGKAQIEDALAIVSGRTRVPGDEVSMPWAVLAQHLTSVGKERMSDEELQSCLQALTGEASVRGVMSSARMAHEILGFEDYESLLADDAGTEAEPES